MAYLVDEKAALRSRLEQEKRSSKLLTRKERKQLTFQAQVDSALAAKQVKITKCPPGPKWQRKLSKRQRRSLEVAVLKDKVAMLESQLESARKRSSNSEFYDSPQWHKLRYEALKRSNGCCELCGDSKATGAIIQVDHIKPRSKYPELTLEQTNLQVLCRPCNMGKSNRDSIDWRTPELKVIRGS